MKLIIAIVAVIFIGEIADGQSLKNSHCPIVEVVRPPGITQPGDTIRFGLDPQVRGLKGLGFQWTTTAGTIIKGQGTAEIEVQTSIEMNFTTVTATVEVSGLPDGCSKSASGSAGLAAGDPVIIDEFGKLQNNDVRGRLDTFLSELVSNKDQIGVIILHAPKGAKQARQEKRTALISDHIFRLRRFPRQRIVIFFDPLEMDTEYTRLYRLPPESVEYICYRCRKYEAPAK